MNYGSVSPTNKTAMRHLLEAGVFGNRARHWLTWDDLRTSGYAGKLTVRSQRPSGPCVYLQSVAELEQQWPANADPSYLCHFNEAMPDNHLELQGEVYRDERGLLLNYSTTPGLAMRTAMREARTATGVVAMAWLQSKLWPSSYDDMQELIATYPDAAIEFSAYSIAVGHLPYRNTVIWEVRNY